MEKLFHTVVLLVVCLLTELSANDSWAARMDQDKTAQYGQEDNLEYISEGTRWETAYYIRDIQNPSDIKEIKENTWLEGTEIVNGKTYMKLWKLLIKSGSQPEFQTYIRTEGQKVYMLPLDSIDTSGECLIYDFSISPGESVIVGGVLQGGKGFWIANDWVVTCKDIRTRNSCGNTFEIMDMGSQVTIDGEIIDFDIESPIWIRGLGTTSGFLNNVADGAWVGLWLNKIYHNDMLIYDNTSGASINIVSGDEIGSGVGMKFHLDGTPFRDGDTGIYIQNGKKYITNTNVSE